MLRSRWREEAKCLGRQISKQPLLNEWQCEYWSDTHSGVFRVPQACLSSLLLVVYLHHDAAVTAVTHPSNKRAN